MASVAADSPDDDSIDLTGSTLGEYRVVRKLGQGGMGQVYLARQLSLKREVALKILRKELAENATALRRFQAEAEAVARVTHANIVQVYTVGEADGLRFMALEYVEGRNLKEYIARKGTPELPQALSVLRQIAAALQRAGEAGLVHRDIKPENVLVTRKGEVKVTDFGLSRILSGDELPLNLTQSGMTLGTPLYMSPEQVQGQPVDHRSDLYSFGVTAYHLLAGEPPFSGTSPFDVAIKHVQAEPPLLATVRPDLPADLCGIVHKLMAKRPEDRYQTAREVIRDLARIQKGLSTAQPSGDAASTLVTSGPGIVVPLSTSYVDSPQLPPASTVSQPALRKRTGWNRYFIVVALMALFAALGWWIGGMFPPELPTAATYTGLPTARPPEPVRSSRERALREKLESRSTKPTELFDAALELGILMVRERRLDDAEQVFQQLEQERYDRPLAGKAVGGPAVLAGRLGQAVVLAFRDQPKESLELFEQILVGSPRPQYRLLEPLLLEHPRFAEIVGDALNRNATSLPPPGKLPARLEWLRTPGGLAEGPKK